MNKDTFSAYHPIVNFLFFGIVIACTMFVTHPVMLIISFISALAYAIYLDGRKTVVFSLKFLLPAMTTTAVINPAFSHEGITILCYLPTGNPLTAESIIYGVFASVMLGAVILWFRCYTAVMTTDKFVYLFGKIIPALSLVLSMTLRFVPKFKAQFEAVRDSQHCIGNDISDGSIFRRIRNAIRIFSIMITWSLENAIETADSMKSRGYGLKGRTAFSIYRMDGRDRNALCCLIFCGIYLFCGILASGLKWWYFPSVRGVMSEPFTISFYIIYLLICSMPVIINRREDKIWRFLKSEI
ncbi:MAG: energy-coupling factor transporter transmembrane protein EcfT [Ruminococcus flavefaciens]|nr:energy-coupling factor transporter transmembrane protein EcfT [Ruminococcus flavefaciens]